MAKVGSAETTLARNLTQATRMSPIFTNISNIRVIHCPIKTKKSFTYQNIIFNALPPFLQQEEQERK